ncbi:MAG: class I SAM-dependent methyltransferase [Deltaproteobacteria bacterium]|nr:MAG: class I SAM-dependent methyltransferase [Deltaproteobacteria bacterium]
MKDCTQFNGSLDFFFYPEENQNLIDHYFPDYNFKNKRVLDTGCRNGGLTNFIFEKGAEVTGIDLNNRAIEKARSLFKGPNFLVGNILDLDMFENNYFDLIICTGTLPYLNSNEKMRAIEEFNRILRPDGKILLAFQKDKNLLFRSVVGIYNLFPKYIRPLLMFIAPYILKNSDSLYIKYAIVEGLINIHFGYPDFLNKNEVATTDSRIISSRFSKSFILEKK